MSAVITTDDRQQVRDAVLSEREERRAVLKRMVDLSPNTKLGRKAGVLLIDVEILDDRIKECGGDVGMERVLFAQVASGVRLKEWAEHYSIERGLLWAWISETDDRLQKYYRALRGVADEYVSEVVTIADGSDNESVKVDEFRAAMRLKVAEKYDQPRFGKQTKVTHEVVGDLGDRLRRAREREIIDVPVDSITETLDNPVFELAGASDDSKEQGQAISKAVGFEGVHRNDMR